MGAGLVRWAPENKVGIPKLNRGRNREENNFGPRYARHDLIVTKLYIHTHKHTHKIIAIFRGRGEG